MPDPRAGEPLRLDIVTILPDYFAPLGLSLLGRAIESGVVQAHVHDLRQWTHDRHRTVDDTPYGGGAGMVMKPEPWGECLDALVPPDSADIPRPLLVVTSASGVPFSQALAHEWADRRRLLFACGRYEGIDARVVDYAATRMDVIEVSLGDYVLFGGEAAALVMIEAVVRLLPGVIGNPGSLAEESHSAGTAGLLEYPAYTKPASWRGREVPAVLLSGNHQAIAQWRAAQSRALTAARRPDLLPDAGRRYAP